MHFITSSLQLLTYITVKFLGTSCSEGLPGIKAWEAFTVNNICKQVQFSSVNETIQASQFKNKKETYLHLKDSHLLVIKS